MKKAPLLTAFLVFVLFDLSGQEIWFTQVPEWGNSFKDLYGKVNVNPQDFKVAGYIFVEEAGGWWTKPSFADPTVTIFSDSSFILDFTTGGLDAYCTRLIVFLLPAGDSPPLFNGEPELPSVLLENYPYAIASRPHGDRLIEWSGSNWTVKRSVNDLPMGPGPNLFSSAGTQVYTDTDNCLHLKIKNNGNGQWLCSELISDTSFGYGTYKFKIKNRVDNFDLNTISGYFTWDDIARYSATAPDNFFREYDIEFSYWTNPANDVGQYVVQPWYNSGNIFRFPVGSLINTLHLWEWKKDTVIFKSMTDDSIPISEFLYSGNDFHLPDKENTRINLYLYNGYAPQSEQEVILSGFEFTNILPSPENLVATDGDTLKITLNWDASSNLFYGIYRGLSADPLKATLLTEEWILQNTYVDLAIEPAIVYYYWVRASDNIYGSNTSGYSSGFSGYDTGWAIDKTSGANNYYSISDLQIVPNPNNGTFSLKAFGNLTGRCQVLIQNAVGMVIYNQDMDLANRNSIPISLNTPGQGIYYIAITCKSCRIMKKVLILR